MNRSFVKMHGLGNDFVIIDQRKDGVIPSEKQRRAIADRQRGVGCDQLIILCPPENPEADFFMRMYNPDASEAGACGNATRCVSRLLFEETGKTSGAVQTVAGILKVKAEPNGLVAVDFGKPWLEWQEIPLAQSCDTLSAPVQIEDFTSPCCVSMGNPHAVFFVNDVNEVPIERIGPQVETHAMFPKKTNVEFAQILDPIHIRMRVWERGAGVTQACGSGACATLVAAVRRGLSARRADIIMDGGTLTIEWRENDGHVLMCGPAARAFEGTLSEELLRE